jgi:acetate kinase
VFTGGIGENSARIRAMTLKHLAVFGFALDETANAATFGGKAGIIGRGRDTIAAVIPTDEEGLIAADATRLVDTITATEESLDRVDRRLSMSA